MLGSWHARCGLSTKGAHYHVTSRGNERKAIFGDDIDWEKFLELIGRAVEQFWYSCTRLRADGQSLPPVDRNPQSRIKRALRYLNGVYTQAFNRRHKRVGHLFQGGEKRGRRKEGQDSSFLLLSLVMLESWPGRYGWNTKEHIT